MRAAGALSAVLLASTVAAAQPRTVLVAGDSHCDHSGVGYNTINGTWRAPLQVKLAAAGIAVDFVGGTADWATHNCATGQLDCDNACYNAASIATLDQQEGLPGGSIPTQVRKLQPNIVIFVGGTNSVLNTQYTLDQDLQQLRSIVLRMYAASPNTVFLIGAPPDTCNGGAKTRVILPFNSRIEDVLADVRAIAPGIKVRLAFNIEPAVSCAGRPSNSGPDGDCDYVNDNGHLSVRGNAKVAQLVFDVLAAELAPPVVDAGALDLAELSAEDALPAEPDLFVTVDASELDLAEGVDLADADAGESPDAREHTEADACSVVVSGARLVGGCNAVGGGAGFSAVLFATALLLFVRRRV